MKIASDWNDYKVIASGDGEKLEKWKDLILLRPDPQAIWSPPFDLKSYKGLCAYYNRSSTGGGEWKFIKKVPDNFTVSRKGLTFSLKLMGFKHTGLFPEQAVNWDAMQKLIKGANREINVLNLFAYTGGATVACLKAGARVCHVDAAKAMVERAKENVALSEADSTKVRYIVDDCFKFVLKELRRGKRYDAIIMDPPSYGRGPSGETWKIENDLASFLGEAVKLLSDKPLFVLINSYTTGLQPIVLSNLLKVALKQNGINGGKTESYEIGLPTEDRDIILPCGASGFYTAEE